MAERIISRPMAIPVQSPSDRIAAACSACIFWLATFGYFVVFTAISLQQYHAYIPHALDLGNMAQTFWNTVHGHPFKFQNMRQHASVEAFGTTTRLSFHVEPIIPFLSIIYFFYQHVETLLVMQTLAVATGAIPTRLLARRHLNNPLAEVVFPVAYLLYPALEAANLYEFHPVTIAAPLLLWAFYFADTERYTLFALTAVAVLGCKEELGLVVALMGLWIAVRNRQWHFGAVVAGLSMAWSFIALKVVVPHFNLADSSYWDRYVPVGFLGNHVVTQSDALHFWLNNPGLVRENLTSEAKLSYLHRILYPVGYLSLLSPLTFLVAVPSLALIMLSYEPHMISGVAHYSAELVPVFIVASILGVEWLAKSVAPRLRLSSGMMIGVCSVYVLIAAILNHRDNGFSPLARSFAYPTITAHDKLVDQVLAMIPAGASVSAQDNMNAHLSDREQIFLYPDLDGNHVQYIVLDATQPTGSVIRTCDMAVQVIGNNAACDIAAGPATPAPGPDPTGINKNALLRNGKWSILKAQDGVLLLKRHHKGERLNTTLPPQFFTFMNPAASDVPPGGPIARFGNSLELEGFQISRTELVNLRNPDVLVTTWWRVLAPLTDRARLMHYLSDNTGALQVFWDDQQATDWATLGQWQVGRLYKVVSHQLSVTTNHSGNIDVDIGVTENDEKYQIVDFNEPITIAHARAGIVAVGGKGGNRVLKLAVIRANL